MSPVPDFGALLNEGVAGLRVGIVRDYFDDLAVDEVKAATADAVELLESLGMSVQELSIPHMEHVPMVQLLTARAENLSPAERVSPHPPAGLQSGADVPAGSRADASRPRVCHRATRSPSHLRRLRPGLRAGGRDRESGGEHAGGDHRGVRARVRGNGGRPDPVVGRPGNPRDPLHDPVQRHGSTRGKRPLRLFRQGPAHRACRSPRPISRRRRCCR